MMKTLRHAAAFAALAILAGLPPSVRAAGTNDAAQVRANDNNKPTNAPPASVRYRVSACRPCYEKTLAVNGSVQFYQGFGRSPAVAEAPSGGMAVFEPTAARLPSGADVLRFDHPLMRRIVDEDASAGLVSVEEGTGWIVVYKDGVPVGWSTGADLAIRRDPATGLWIEQLEDRTLVFYGADNVPDHLVTPAGVRLDWGNAGLDVVWDGNAIGQVRSVADGLMDVAKLSPTSFRLAWYPPAAVGEKENGRYAATGNPAKTFTFSYSKVGTEHRYALREYRNEQFNFDYLWTTEDGIDWTLVRDPDGLRLSDRKESAVENGVRTIRRTHSDAAGGVLVSIEKQAVGLIGATEIGRAAVAGNGATLVEWSAARGEYGGAAGRLVSVTNEWGGVAQNAYDAVGRRLSETETVFGSLEQVTAYAYETNLVDGFPDRRPRRVLVTRGGVVVSDTAYDYGFAPDGGRLDVVTRTDPASGVSLVSSRLHYPAASTNAAEAGRLRLAVSEDRTATLYAYAPTANGGYVRTSTRGCIAGPDASAPVADASRFAVVPSQSSRTVETVDFRGDAVRADEYVHTGDGWSPAGWTTYVYNLAHKRTGFADHKGDRESSDWICTGPVWQDLADGTAVTNTFDKAKRLATSTHYTPFGAVTTAYSYDPLDRVTGTTVSTNGVSVRGTLAAYDARGRRVLSVDELGRTNTVAYSADNRTVTRTTQAGAVTTTALNTDGSTATVSGNVRPYETRSHGVDPATGLSWIETRTAQNDSAPSVLASRTFQNALGQAVRVETPAPNGLLRASLSAYNALGQLVSEQTEYRTQTQPLTSHLSPLTTSYAYGALGDLVRTTQTSTSGVWRAQASVSRYALDPDGSVWTRDFSISSCSDPAIAALTNRMDRKLAPLSQSERSLVVSYDLRGNATHETESFDRASACNESLTQVPWAAEPSRSVALAGRTVEVVDFASVTNRFDYDAFGQRVSGTDGLGNATVYAYDAAGRLLSATDPAGFTTSYAYDAAGRRVATTDALGNTVFTDYDAAGRVVAESGATYPVRKGYDAYGRWTSLKTTRDGSTWDETQWTYDEASGVQIAKIYADGSVVRHDYDEDGRPTRTIWARGAWFENRYDEWGRIVAVVHDDPTIDAAMSYDAFGHLVFSSNNAAAYRYTYDNRGLVTNELSAIGGMTNTIVRDFDTYGRLSRLRIADSDYDQTYAYDDAGRLSVIGIPGSTVTYAYTPDSLDAGYSVLTPSNAVLTRALTRDPLRRGLITSVSNLVNGVDSGSSFDYTYDALGRPVMRNLDEFGYNARGEIAWARYGTNTMADVYDYDFIGNFTSNRLRGAWSQFEANELNEYIAIVDSNPRTIAYDADGNLLTNGVATYQYDSENRLSSIRDKTRDVTFSYDTRSRRVLSMEAHSVLRHWYDDWNEIQELIDRENYSERIVYHWGNDLFGSNYRAGGIGGLFGVCSPNGMAHPVFDNIGNIASYVTPSGNRISCYEYDAFGSPIGCRYVLDDKLFYRFSTKRIESGLGYFGQRFFCPVVGRWMNRDPKEEMGGLNLFAAFRNQPLSIIDPIGLDLKYVSLPGHPYKSVTRADRPYYLWGVFWKLDTPAEKDGVVIQEIEKSVRITKCDGTVIENYDYHYWEVVGKILKERISTVRSEDNQYGDDIWGHGERKSRSCTKGVVQFKGKANFYPGTTNPEGFEKTGLGPWGSAPHRTTPPVNLPAPVPGPERTDKLEWSYCDRCSQP